LHDLKQQSGIAMLFISHDLAVVRLVADRTAVLFGGEIMEIGQTEAVMSPPFHPYTHALLQAVPKPLRRTLSVRARRDPVPPASADVRGCAYAARFRWKVGPICDRERPPWREAGPGQRIRCHLSLETLTEHADSVAQQGAA
jgi:peptide/nickel transport system ATP-binding protein